MKKNTFKVLFYIRGNQINKEGKAPIMIRITIDGEVEQLNSKLTIEPQLWDVAASKAKGRSAKILELNSRLNDIQVIMKDHYYDIQRRHGYVTAEMVKNAYIQAKALRNRVNIGQSGGTIGRHRAKILTAPQRTGF